MSLKSATPISNFVLIKLYKNDTVKFASGVEFIIPPFANNDSERTPLRGEVIMTPDQLTFKQGNHALMPWKCEMELLKGDDVIVKRPALEMALSKDNGSYFEENGDIYCYLKYSELVLAIRGEEIIMLNGMVLVSPIDEELPQTNIAGFEQSKKESTQYGIIAHIGKPNQEYHNTKDSRGNEIITEDDPNLKVGDKILFSKAGNIKLEQELHQSLGKKYWRMPRTKILAVI